MDHVGLSRPARRKQVRRLTGLVAGGLGVVVALAAAAVPSAPRGPITRFQGVLRGVDAASPSAAWAVGDFDVNGGPATVLLHWNGRSWTRAATPIPAARCGR